MTSFSEVYSLVRCVECAADLESDSRALGRCFACELGVQLRAQLAAYRERDWAAANCAKCAARFNVPGPADGRLCEECRRAQSNEDQS